MYTRLTDFLISFIFPANMDQLTVLLEVLLGSPLYRPLPGYDRRERLWVAVSTKCPRQMK